MINELKSNTGDFEQLIDKALESYLIKLNEEEKKLYDGCIYLGGRA